jgi:hypothetical protein
VSARGVGYKLVAGMGQLEKSDGYVERSRRQFRQGLETVQTIDDGAISRSSDRQLVDKIRIGMIAIAGVLEMQAQRVAEHDQQLAQLMSGRMDDRARARATEEEVDRLRQRLEELENRR